MERWIIIISLLFALITMCECDGRQQVCGIINGLVPESDVLVHCKSKQDDLGVHLLHYNALYEFKFKPNFWGTTQFYCNFTWPSRIEWFDIYKFKRDAGKFCYWMIKPDGPCKYNGRSKSFDNCYKWNKKI
ncbi:unnamed protein product [Prunus armeniaca]|uniref:S-protein homolog n=1 Tax=Prunus armeniaca TaxID=36596 RepID=A0A6J5VTF6_PRUAR|nr:unnamed protein product [Prunus armeniaca]